jgi:hypothetical protein
LSTYKYNWTHENWCRPSDPINIIFENIGLDEIEKFLLSQGWKSCGVLAFAFDQVIPYPSLFEKRRQDRQFVGPGRICILRRCHIRLWDIERLVFAGIHYDAFRFIGHTPTDFETPKQFFTSECMKNPDWETKPDYIELDNRTGGYKQPYSNGKATLVRRKGVGSNNLDSKEF